MRSHFEHLEVNGNALVKYDLQADVGGVWLGFVFYQHW